MAKRLIKIAKELNVGTSTIVEYLVNNGFEIDNKPTAQVSDEMYDKLIKEFQGSVVIKEKADQLIIGTRIPPKKEAPVVAKDSSPFAPKKETPPPPPKEPETPPVVDKEPEPVVETKEELVEKPKIGLTIKGKIDLEKKKEKKEKEDPTVDPAEEEKDKKIEESPL